VAGRADLLHELPRTGRALDLACGLGSVTLWLAARGLDVTALDISDVAIGRLRAAAAELGLGPRVDADVADLDHGLHASTQGVDTWDRARFDVIICQRYLDPGVLAGSIELLRPGGILAASVLSAVGAPAPGRFHAAPGELLRTLATHATEVIDHREFNGVASAIVRRR